MKNTYKVVNKDLVDLKPNKLNYQIYENTLFVADDLLEDIKKNGLLEPLVVNSDNTIISGHRRFVVLQKLEMKKVQCRVIDYDDEDLMLISYNKQRVKSKEEKDREILFVRDYVVKPPKMGRPTKNTQEKPKGSVRKQISEITGQSESSVQRTLQHQKRIDETLMMMGESDNPAQRAVLEGMVKKDVIKMHNELERDKNLVTEQRTKGTRRDKSDYLKEYTKVFDRFNPSFEEVMDAVKHQFNLTFDSRIQDYLKK